MAVKNSYIDKIMEKLTTLDVYKVILFGSYANDKEDEESDIDLLIVLDENTLPKNYDEWLEIKMKVRRILREINKKVAIDLLVYIRPQYELLKKEMNSFQKEIHESGKILYEKQAKEWMKFAKTDLQATMAIITEENLSTVAAFHTQQCIEKSLKAILELNKKKHQEPMI